MLGSTLVMRLPGPQTIRSAPRMARIASGFACMAGGSRKISFTWPCSVIDDSPRTTTPSSVRAQIVRAASVAGRI
jgi:hypothetical protein